MSLFFDDGHPIPMSFTVKQDSGGGSRQGDTALLNVAFWNLLSSSHPDRVCLAIAAAKSIDSSQMQTLICWATPDENVCVCVIKSPRLELDLISFPLDSGIIHSFAMATALPAAILFKLLIATYGLVGPACTSHPFGHDCTLEPSLRHCCQVRFHLDHMALSSSTDPPAGCNLLLQLRFFPHKWTYIRSAAAPIPTRYDRADAARMLLCGSDPNHVDPGR
jgi:hypothetical protein